MSSNDKVDDPTAKLRTKKEYSHREINWFAALWHLHLHIFAVYAVILIFTEAKLSTFGLAIVVGTFCLLGVTAGAHRLWAHRSYAASLPLRVFLLICQTASCTGSIYDWVLEHRIHHKFHGTDDDPFNHNRGFWHAHLWSRMVSRPANWNELVRQVDMSDVETEKLVMFQKRFYWVLMPMLAFLTPVNFPIEFWNETIFTSMLVAFVLRQVIVNHGVWLISSGIRLWGLRPETNYSFDTNLVFMVNLSMWPHYHYMLPWDYQTDEYGSYASSCTTSLIRAWAAMGWASELRTVDTAGVRTALERSVHDGKPFVDAVQEEGLRYSERIKHEHLLHHPVQFF